MAFVNVQAAVWPDDTLEDFKEKMRTKFLHCQMCCEHFTSQWNSSNIFSHFRPYGNRGDFQNMYEMNDTNSTGFFRHVFNLIFIGRDDSEQFNSNHSQSHIERTELEKNMFDNMEDDERLQDYWRNALGSLRPVEQELCVYVPSPFSFGLCHGAVDW